MSASDARRYDAIVVGGGHNGLVAGFYLARAGLKTVVLERRPFVGGACVTEEFAPGYFASSGAYVLSMLREAIYRDMRIVERGLVVDPAGPSLNLFADGSHLYLHDEMEPSIEEIGRFSRGDAAAVPKFEADLIALAKGVRPVFDWTPPDPRMRGIRDIPLLLKYGMQGFRNRKSMQDAAFLFTTSVTRFLGERFESDQVKAAYGWHAINDSTAGPSTPGTAYVLLHDHAAEEVGGAARSWGFVRGGMGKLTEMMADAAREAGAEIRCDAEASRVLTRSGRATGVELAGGEELRAPRVISNADPKRTFLGLVEPEALPREFVAAIREYRCEGTSIKINLAVDALPHAEALPGDGVQPYHRGIMEMNQPLADMDRAQNEARNGQPANEPHIELCFPTVHDPSLAPEGKHIVTIDVNSQPYTLREDSWDDIKESVADRAIEQLEGFFPGLSASILHRQVLSPLDLERQLGLTGGHALHGEMLPEQLFFMRPVRGWGDYRTPVRGLYLCGAGTHPGGGVTGANGRNCAREVLRDSRKKLA